MARGDVERVIITLASGSLGSDWSIIFTSKKVAFSGSRVEANFADLGSTRFAGRET